jgi:hypothetical protein
VAFVSWCQVAARAPLPVDHDTITAYLTSLTDTQSYGTLANLKPSTLYGSSPDHRSAPGKTVVMVSRLWHIANSSC